MGAVSRLRALAASLIKCQTGGSAQRRALSHVLCSVEAIEPRLLLSSSAGTFSAIQMLSATTTDSKSVTIEYRVNPSHDPGAPIQFGVYRSSDRQFNSNDTPVDTLTLAPTDPSPGKPAAILDSSNEPATAPGIHRLTIPLPQGLSPFPEKPYVLVVANPGLTSATTDPAQTASFRTYTIAVVTHGGIQDTSWKHGPPWELQIAWMLKQQGYDSVIAYNWVNQSSTPGEAIKQSPRLARIILHTAAKFPADAPVNLDMIGHSEGTVVNTYALVALEGMMNSQLKAGYITDTLLDPHAANNNVSGKQYSVAGPLAWLADMEVSHYQGQAKDPPAFFPSLVDQAQVFYQHTQASAGAIYNLWGQVPVKTEGPFVHYYNLTPMKVNHSGKRGVSAWYRNFIVPTLGDQAPLVSKLQLDGQIDQTDSNATATGTTSAARAFFALHPSAARQDRIYGPTHVVQTSQPEFSGTAAPGSVVRLTIGPVAKPWDMAIAGTTMATTNGQWSLMTHHPLRNGQYRTVVSAFSRALRTRPGLTIVPTQPLGRLVVDAPSAS
jgi:hypothetical protein